MSEQEMTIGFIGNPNCGKTTLFNAYTGANLKAANWPGVTVEKVEGVMKDHELTIHLVSGDWNVRIKAAFCPSRRTLFPNGRL